MALVNLSAYPVQPIPRIWLAWVLAGTEAKDIKHECYECKQIKKKKKVVALGKITAQNWMCWCQSIGTMSDEVNMEITWL